MTIDQVRQRLKQLYPTAEFSVADMTGGQNHYQVQIICDSFEGMSRIQRHKSVMAAFDSELKSGEMHALTIQAKTEQESQS